MGGEPSKGEVGLTAKRQTIEFNLTLTLNLTGLKPVANWELIQFIIFIYPDCNLFNPENKNQKKCSHSNDFWVRSHH